MATNAYFGNYQNSAEQQLIENLAIESIKIYGLDMWYLPRTLNARDGLLNEDDLPTFQDAYMAEFYVKTVDGFEGDGDFLSKFGLQIRDSATLVIARRVFEQEIAFQDEALLDIPREGDLIYLPLNDKIFEIMDVEHESIFYQMGALQVFELKTELMEYSGERFQTGLGFIDTKFDPIDFTNNPTENVDPLADNFEIETEADAILDFSQNNPFAEDY